MSTITCGRRITARDDPVCVRLSVGCVCVDRTAKVIRHGNKFPPTWIQEFIFSTPFETKNEGDLPLIELPLNDPELIVVISGVADYQDSARAFGNYCGGSAVATSLANPKHRCPLVFSTLFYVYAMPVILYPPNRHTQPAPTKFASATMSGGCVTQVSKFTRRATVSSYWISRYKKCMWFLRGPDQPFRAAARSQDARFHACDGQPRAPGPRGRPLPCRTPRRADDHVVRTAAQERR